MATTKPTWPSTRPRNGWSGVIIQRVSAPRRIGVRPHDSTQKRPALPNRRGWCPRCGPRAAQAMSQPARSNQNFSPKRNCNAANQLKPPQGCSGHSDFTWDEFGVKDAIDVSGTRSAEPCEVTGTSGPKEKAKSPNPKAPATRRRAEGAGSRRERARLPPNPKQRLDRCGRVSVKCCRRSAEW
jgi:hypothetical protein